MFPAPIRTEDSGILTLLNAWFRVTQTPVPLASLQLCLGILPPLQSSTVMRTKGWDGVGVALTRNGACVISVTATIKAVASLKPTWASGSGPCISVARSGLLLFSSAGLSLPRSLSSMLPEGRGELSVPSSKQGVPLEQREHEAIKRGVGHHFYHRGLPFGARRDLSADSGTVAPHASK